MSAVDEVTPVAVAFDLRWWHRSAPTEVDAVLHAAGIELDDLPTLPDLPADVVRGALADVARAADDAPDDAALARRRARIRTLLGGVSPDVVATPVDIDDGVRTPAEVVQALVADGRRAAGGEVSEHDLAVMLDHVDAGYALGWLAAPPPRSLRAVSSLEAIAAHRDALLAVALPSVAPPVRAAAAEDWLAWVNEAPAPRNTTVGRARSQSPLAATRRHVLLAIVLTVVIGTLVTVLPRSMPGEMPEDQLIDGVGYLEADGGRWVTIRTDDDTRRPMTLVFDGSDATIAIARVEGRWTRRATGIDEDSVAVYADDDHLVVALPASLAADGVAVERGGGRSPIDGFVPVRDRSSGRVNVVDLAIIALLGWSLFRGYRRGIESVLPSLAVLLVSLVVVRVVHRPLSSALGSVIATERASGALAFSIAMTAAGVLLAVSVRAAWMRLPARVRELRSRTAASRALAAAFAGVRTALSLGIVTVLVADLAAVTWLADAVSDSPSARLFTDAMRTVFTRL